MLRFFVDPNYLHSLMSEFTKLFDDHLKQHPNWRVSFVLFGLMEKIGQFDNEVSTEEIYPLKSATYNIHIKENTESIIASMIADLNDRLDDLNATGSGWVNIINLNNDHYL